MTPLSALLPARPRRAPIPTTIVRATVVSPGLVRMPPERRGLHRQGRSRQVKTSVKRITDSRPGRPRGRGGKGREGREIKLFTICKDHPRRLKPGGAEGGAKTCNVHQVMNRSKQVCPVLEIASRICFFYGASGHTQIKTEPRTKGRGAEGGARLAGPVPQRPRLD